MKIKLRELINYLILNDGWIGFQGDSEYEDECGRLRMGHWSFVDIINTEESSAEDYYTLDDEIDDSELSNNITWNVKNDNGEVCIVEIIYNDYDDYYDPLSAVSSSIGYVLKQNIHLDKLKSKYIALADDLKDTIGCNSCNECDYAINSEEKIKALAFNLYESEEDLRRELIMLIEFIKDLDSELYNLIEEK